MAAGLVLGLRPDVPGLVLGVALWGIHMALTQGVLAALVIDTCPPALRGTALGPFGLMTAGALLAGSTAAGWLWDAVSPTAAWLAVAAVAGTAFAGFAVLSRPTT
ncbi:MAG: hypothetical protein JNM50_01825 [Chromatiales bacterium]|jgi:hypothetical protein|nr:hypothetical protein [Chromatiales bacterium]